MAGRGRGRGQLTFNVDALGIKKGEALPPTMNKPSPLFPVRFRLLLTLALTYFLVLVFKVECVTLSAMFCWQPMQFQPVPLQTGEAVEYMLALKQEFRASTKNLPFHIVPAKPKRGECACVCTCKRKRDKASSISITNSTCSACLHVNHQRTQDYSGAAYV